MPRNSDRNRNTRGAARTAVNQARAAFEANEPETKEAILKAISALDKAAEKAGQAMDKAADSVKETAKDAADKVKEATK